MPLCVALVHSPVVNKHGKVVTSSITNFDIHDIARSCRTFGVDRYFIVTPSEPQQWLARRIVRHWGEGWGATYNPRRKDALSLIEVVSDLPEAVSRAEALLGQRPWLVGTSARPRPESLSTQDLRTRLETGDEAFCLVFGTGWGIHGDLMDSLDFSLEPIRGVGDYNHLSVRAAVAIILDRLRGTPTA
jgi:hypothetical protein